MKNRLNILAVLLVCGMLFSCATTNNAASKADECILTGYIQYRYSADGKNYYAGPATVTINNGIKVSVKSNGTFTFKGKLNKFYSITDITNISGNRRLMLYGLNYFAADKNGIMCDVVYSYDGSNLSSYADGKIGVYYKNKYEDITGFSSQKIYKALDDRTRLTKIVVFNETSGEEREKNPKKWMEKSIEYIDMYSNDDFERVLFACKLIAANMEYDNKTYEKSKSYQSYRLNIDNANRILKKGTGMCYEYSIVLKKFCDEMNIPCVVVSGRSKSTMPDASWDEVNTNDLGNHAWNVVIIDGKKYYIDLTWADTPGLNKNWIFTDPVEFRKTHRSYSPEY